MLFGPVDIPEPLVEAQRKNELVVFCGAGVSAAPPSSLPMFDELVARIARECNLPRGGSEQPDRYLGRVISERGFPVHATVAGWMMDPQSAPSALHVAVVGLFNDADSLRIVTTNFDRHLSSAAHSVWLGGIDEFAAPALPLGDHFSGIVYVHGDAGRSSERLVLTDADFGSAYLTRGYARRFLVDCFQTFTVLFVGYSHDDRIMNYLARGLPPARAGAPRRFAFGPASQRAKWEYLGVELIPYDPNLDPEGPHSAVRLSLERWGEVAKWGYAKHESEITRIVGQGPNTDRETQDYLRRQLQDWG